MTLDATSTTLSNEFATVELRIVDTEKGKRLEITAPKLGYRTQLDPIELESLTWQDKAVFSEFLREPFGPEDDVG